MSLMMIWLMVETNLRSPPALRTESRVTAGQLARSFAKAWV
jgi:hypothetical protein